jgi:hypothetical protein
MRFIHSQLPERRCGSLRPEGKTFFWPQSHLLQF